MIEDLLRPQHLLPILGVIVVLAVAGAAAVFAVRWLWRMMPPERGHSG
jgi:hypothetical protein